MDQNALSEVISHYKETFETHRPREIYKWEAVKCFQDNWNEQTDSIEEMFRKALNKQINLLTPYEYMGLIALAKARSRQLLDMFIRLYEDDGASVAEKIKRFLSSVAEIAKSDSGDVVKHNQNERSVCVYLFLKNPEENFLYNRVGKFDRFAKSIGYAVTDNITGISKLEEYYTMCDKILEFVLNDQELLSMSSDSLKLPDNKYYQDENYRLLADDIVYIGSHKTEDDVIKFKKLLEWFVTQLRINNGIIEGKVTSGQGYNGDKIRNAYKEWNSYSGFNIDLECTIQTGFQKNTRANYIHYDRINIVANFVKVGDKSDVDGLQILVYNPDMKTWRESSQKTLLELGLFDGDPPNDVLTGFYDKYMKTIKDFIGGEEQEKATTEKNIILYGPPGTGKTYNTVRYAVAIIEAKPLDDIFAENYNAVRERYIEYKEKGLIAFTTFHQSYGYEEFIEGIRPVMTSDDSDSSKDIEYEVRDGVFKAFCNSAIHGTTLSNDEIFDKSWESLVAASRCNAENMYIFTRRTGTEIKTILVNDVKFRVSWQSDQNSHNDLTKESIRRQWLSDINRDSLSGGSRWLYDARQSIIDEMVEKFNLNYSVENTQNNHVFIIDEINRGNISKIFGELITLIEPSKRINAPEELRAELPYSQHKFGVPKNIYIVGTMNTADRSIAMMDTALRRRFEFVEIRPDVEEIRKRNITVDGIDIADLLDKMNKRIQALHDREHTIGHSFFLPLEDDCTLEKLAQIFEKKIMPLLQEYFYDDYDKIRLVLGDNQKSDRDLQFVIRENVDNKALFGNVGDEIIDDAINYTINTNAFRKVNAYDFLK